MRTLGGEIRSRFPVTFDCPQPQILPVPVGLYTGPSNDTGP
jgi:hypothetical protein